ncbi:hypothetical protein B0T20DRAFT_509527 [Sordaria brevicollis]|uniref:Uncharacterized protein n=1 Tax=Sordaria brevicollis TaxID=83679 RepID=A0AAE0P9C1_SORBR|nr:hypothetical protein B0T20DRAFT_509527 [Sordaria brevicollis]
MSSPTLSTSDQTAPAIPGTPAASQASMVSTTSTSGPSGQHANDDHSPDQAEKPTPAGSSSAVVQTKRSARAKHLKYEPAPTTTTNAAGKTNAAADDSDDDEEFSMKDLEELNANKKHRMEKKTKQFVRMVQETHWGSRVEDLGSVKEIEE